MTANALRAAATGEKPKEQRTILQLLQDPRIGAGLAAVAGKYMTRERLLRLCINAVKKTPRLMDCDPQTVLGAMMTSCALGLEPNTVQQQAFLIPYKKSQKIGTEWVETYDCQFQIGARGYVTLAYRSEHIESLDAAAIHDGDVFEHMRGSNAFLKYATALRDRGALLGAFSYVRLAGGGESSVVLPLDEIMKIRSKSETYRSLVKRVDTARDEREKQRAVQTLAETPWVMWEDDMATKSAIKKHAKNLPIAAGDSFAVAAGIDEQGETGALDLGAMVDPDRARAAMSDVDDVPVLENQPSEQLPSSNETFGAAARQAEPVQRAAASPASKPAAKRAAPKAGVDPLQTAASGKAVSEGVQSWVEGVTGAKSRDLAIEALDLARTDLNPEDHATVAKAFHERWGD